MSSKIDYKKVEFFLIYSGLLIGRQKMLGLISIKFSELCAECRERISRRGDSIFHRQGDECRSPGC